MRSIRGTIPRRGSCPCRTAATWAARNRTNAVFCPVDFLVPSYRVLTWDSLSDRMDGQVVEMRPVSGERMLWEGTRDASSWIARAAAAVPEEPRLHVICNPRVSEPKFCPFALVAGCVWGDDSSMKVEFVDLAGVAAGKIVREDRFGYLELPHSLSLSDAVSMHGWSPERPVLTIAHATDFDLRMRVTDVEPRTVPLGQGARGHGWHR